MTEDVNAARAETEAVAKELRVARRPTPTACPAERGQAAKSRIDELMRSEADLKAQLEVSAAVRRMEVAGGRMRDE
eukprot:531226-Rhodomonas_salina.1